MSAADTTTTTTGKAPKSRTPASSNASARHHPYKKNGRGGRGKGRGFVARFHASSAVAASTSASTNSPPSTSSTPRGPRVWLHDRCDTDEQRRLRQEIVERNPHIAQAFFAADEFPEESFPFTRTLGSDFPCLPYRERKHEIKSVIPWGQRRLFLAELEFLSLHTPSYLATSPPSPLVLYAGAAPGTHLNYLARLFPSLTFILFDSAPFRCRPTRNLKLHSAVFTDSDALEWSGQSVLFVSDVRSADLFHSSVQDVDRAIQGDMADQMRWVELLQPYRSLIKFRLPWSEGVTHYLKGELHLPVWGSQTTTECRLVVGEVEYTGYDHRTYEQRMFHFNTRHRVQLYDEKREEGERDEGWGGRGGKGVSRHRDRSLSGLDHCYDCTAELFILKQFLISQPQEQDRLRRLIRKGKGTSGSEAEPLIGVDAATPSPSSIITARSPASALSENVAQRAAVFESIIPTALQSLQLHRETEVEGEEERVGMEVTGREEKEEGRGLGKGGEGEGESEECVCIDCCCVVLSDELSAELSEGRTLLTAPLLPAAIGTANAKAKNKEKKAKKAHKNRIKQKEKQHRHKHNQPDELMTHAHSQSDAAVAM